MTLLNPAAGDAFRAWLYRPFIDLGPTPQEAPFEVLALEFDFRSLVEAEPLPRLQISLNPSYREAVLRTAGTPEYQVTLPTELPVPLRSDRWEALCEHVDSFADLAPRQQVRVGWLLAKLCLFEAILMLIPSDAVDDVAAGDDHASLAYLRVWARFKKWLDNDCEDFSAREFEPIALEAPPGIARIDAGYEMVRQYAKFTDRVEECERWQRVHRESIDAAADQLDDFELGLMMSRYHRVGGFIPQMRRDGPGVEREMTAAEEMARGLTRHDEAHRIAADEMLYAALESRMREALWLGELDLALERATEYLSLAPRAPRGWMHRGEVLLARDEVDEALGCYREAARLAAAAEEALFMLGQCHELRGDLDNAVDAYLQALRFDPLGTSAAERLEQVARESGNEPVLEWAHSHLAELRRVTPKASWPDPYRHIPPPEAEVSDSTTVSRP